MKRLPGIVWAMILALTISGQAWAAKPKPPKPTKDKFVKLVKAEMLPDFRWKYILKLKKKAGKKNSLPFALGEFSQWEVEDLGFAPKSKKYYYLEVITFNREIKFNYGGWYDAKLPPEKWSWAPIRKSKFYDKDRKILVVGFYNGQLYKKGMAPFAPAPGQFGDDVARFDINIEEGKATVYFNDNKVNGSVAKPFFIANLRKWAVEFQQISNSDGWGSATFKVQFPLTIDFTFGGDYEDDIWAVISGSKYYYVDPDGHQFLRVCFHRGQQSGEKAFVDGEAGITVDACKEVIKVEPIKLISKQRLDDFRWQYKFGLRKYAIISERLFPVIIADVLDNWKVISLTDEDGDGYYEIVVESFNREISLLYADSHNDPDMSKWTWADAQHSAFWDAASQAIVIGLHEGDIFPKGQAPFAVPPGAQGDDFLRFGISLDGQTLTVYFNNNKVNGSVKKPAKRWNLDRWVLANQRIKDSSGWGEADIDLGLLGLPLTIDSTYSGDGENSPVSGIQNSQFYFKDEATGDEFFRVCVQ